MFSLVPRLGHVMCSVTIIHKRIYFSPRPSIWHRGMRIHSAHGGQRNVLTNVSAVDTTESLFSTLLKLLNPLEYLFIPKLPFPAVQIIASCLRRVAPIECYGHHRDGSAGQLVWSLRSKEKADPRQIGSACTKSVIIFLK